LLPKTPKPLSLIQSSYFILPLPLFIINMS